MQQTAGAFRRRVETLALLLTPGPAPRARHLAALWLFGSVALAAATWVSVLLDLDDGTVAFAYLIIIVLLSLLDSFISSVVFSFVALAALDFFFVVPRFTFQVEYKQDLLTLAGFVVASLVVTGLVRRMRDLANTYREQARLLDLTQDAVVARDVNDSITYWNRAAEELYGWAREEAIGKTPHDLLQTQFPVPLDEIRQSLLRSERWEGELLHTKRDGKQFPVASRWSLQRDANGRPVGTLETNTDITERKQTEEALRRSQAAYLAEAQKLSTTGSFGWNAATGEISWSEEVFRIFGYDAATVPSLEVVMRRVHPADAALAQRVARRAARDKREFDVAHRLLMEDGSVKHIRVVAEVVTDEPGTLQFVGAIMDVSSAKQAQEQLSQAQAELAHVTRLTTFGELSASIAHEVNQPLAAIVTWGETGLRLLSREPPLLDEVREALKCVIRDARRASQIVERIRALTKRAQPKTGPVDLNNVVREGLTLVDRELANHRVVLLAELMPRLSAVLGDRIQLQQVIINLVLNGIQAMDAVEDRPRELVIRSSQDQAGQVLISVQDSGGGIDPVNASHLFDAFFTTKPNGMGMGLAICRSIIDAHGGRLGASNNDGPGATFQFSLPSIREGAA